MAKAKKKEETGLAIAFSSEVTNVGLAALKKKYAKVPDVNTDKGYERAKEALSVLGPIRRRVELTRKDLKKKVNEEAKRILAELATLEVPIKEAKNARDVQIKKEAEERAALIQAKIDAIKQFAVLKADATSEQVDGFIAILIKEKTTLLDGDFGRRKTEANKLYEETLKSLNTSLIVIRERERAKKEAEERAVKEKAEREQREKEAREREKINEREKAEIRAEKKRIRDRQKAMDRQQAEMDRRQAEMDAANEPKPEPKRKQKQKQKQKQESVVKHLSVVIEYVDKDCPVVKKGDELLGGKVVEIELSMKEGD